ncbi:unnamed protein product [Chondrus crispus]|uniref:MAGE domain-containing protein n=1 Tax=Chondrus crispus TaxID=2769 RepID=R7QHC7_CHOCR|nr:unnamed protein product [Chondrus crispus]CDF36830.1 unnamed protein product [Chondrus crispus]|eukprot:XP_005716649.1 unnamed protein product [Chondrus crispus]
MTRSRSRSFSQRRASQSEEIERIEIDSDDEYQNRGAPMRKDGSSSLPDGGFSALAEEQQDELVKRVIRLMICRNAEKRPVKREELSRHMFANMAPVRSKSKVFQGTFNVAQQKLRSIFGMQMVLIQRQVKANQSASSRTQTQLTQSGPVGTKGYILVSVLPPELRAEERKDRAGFGFLMVVAGMILLEPGCRIEQGALYRALGRVGVHVTEKNGHRQLNGGNVKELLESTLLRQWYLEREKEDQTFYFMLGPRFRAEIGPEDLVEFVGAVYNLSDSKTGGLDETSKSELRKRLDDTSGISQEDVEGEEED